MRILLIGPPCAGKSTVGNWLSLSTGLPFLSMGNIYRDNKHLLPVDTVTRVDQGGLMSDAECMSFLLPILERLSAGGWILDGVPRTVGQAMLMRDNMDMAFSFHVDDEQELVRRMQARLFHLPSGRTYSPFAPSHTEGIDDLTGEPLSKRSDDNVEVFMKRLAGHNATIGAIEHALQPKLTVISGRDSHQNLRHIENLINGHNW